FPTHLSTPPFKLLFNSFNGCLNPGEETLICRGGGGVPMASTLSGSFAVISPILEEINDPQIAGLISTIQTNLGTALGCELQDPSDQDPNDGAVRLAAFTNAYAGLESIYTIVDEPTTILTPVEFTAGLNISLTMFMNSMNAWSSTKSGEAGPQIYPATTNFPYGYPPSYAAERACGMITVLPCLCPSPAVQSACNEISNLVGEIVSNPSAGAIFLDSGSYARLSNAMNTLVSTLNSSGYNCPAYSLDTQLYTPPPYGQ
nr:hypothetical protein [Simkaniaceae bacterium]